ncbi:MAG: alpha/beta fold hydrolase [Congregibacter sp.]|nr:alpha/beta fold hydrolase [Congregibacter sp.]
MTSQTAWSAAADFWPRADTSRFVRVGNIDFHVQVSGSGEEVLLLHGAGASAHSFSGLAARLSERHRVIAADLPGQGFTTLLPLEAVGLTPFARYLRDLMAALDAEPRWIIGHSAGAALAAEYALTADSPPKGILCINAAFNPFGSLAAPLFSKTARWFARSAWLPRALASPALRWRATGSMLADTGSAVDPLMSRCYDTLLSNPDHIAGTLRMMAGWDLPPLLASLSSLQMPVWLAAAEGDRTIPPDRSTSVVNDLPHARSVRIPDLGHLAHEEDPDIFDDLFQEMVAITTL